MDRRQAVVAFGALLPLLHRELPTVFADESGRTETRVQTLLRRELPKSETADDSISFSVLHVRYAPGAESKPHIHPVAAFVYVLSGAIDSQVEGEMPRKYSAGEYFFEEPRHKHSVARNPSPTDPAEFLATFVGKSNLPLTAPLDEGVRRQE
jgi:quercetin dioxygenase-like cupin family protein